jgi:hypothetical protein
MTERHAHEITQLLKEAGHMDEDYRKPPRGAWLELRAYRDASKAVEEVVARDPREWWGCSYGKDQAVAWAMNELHVRRNEAEMWGAWLRTRVDAHVRAEDNNNKKE